MTGDATIFQNYTPCYGDYMVRIVDSSLSKVAGTGSIAISMDLTLDSFLFVSNLDCNLLSISKFTYKKNYVNNFFLNYCVFQDLNSRKMIDNAKVCSRLYIFKVANYIERQPQSAIGEKRYLFVFSSNKDSDVILWHYCLGHPSFTYLKKLFPLLFTKSSNVFHCKIF